MFFKKLHHLPQTVAIESAFDATERTVSALEDRLLEPILLAIRRRCDAGEGWTCFEEKYCPSAVRKRLRDLGFGVETWIYNRYSIHHRHLVYITWSVDMESLHIEQKVEYGGEQVDECLRNGLYERNVELEK